MNVRFLTNISPGLIICIIFIIILIVIYIIKNIKIIKSTPTYIPYKIIKNSKYIGFYKETYNSFICFIEAINKVREYNAYLLSCNKKVKACKRLLLNKKKAFYENEIQMYTNELKNAISKCNDYRLNHEQLTFAESEFQSLINAVKYYNDKFSYRLNSGKICNDSPEYILAFFNKDYVYYEINNDTLIVFFKLFYINYNFVSGSFYYSNYSLSVNRIVSNKTTYSVGPGEEVLSKRWLHQRNDGGPDRRYSTNYATYVIRYAEIDVKNGIKSTRIYYKNVDKSKEDEDIYLKYAKNYETRIIKFVHMLEENITKQQYLERKELSIFKNISDYEINKLKTIKDKSISKINIPNFITYLGDGCFDSCSCLKTLNLNKVETVGKNVFSNCINLTSIYGFENIKNDILNDMTFSNCSLLSEITLPTTIEQIGCSVFKQCKSLSKVNNFENLNIETIPFGLFEGCESLRYITIPNTIKNIEDRAFYNCKSIFNIRIPKNIEYIGPYAFYNCSKICYFNSDIPYSLNITDDIKIDPTAYIGCKILNMHFNVSNFTEKHLELIKNCKAQNITIPENISYKLFSEIVNCKFLSSIKLIDTELSNVKENKNGEICISDNIEVLELPKCVSSIILDNNFNNKKLSTLKVPFALNWLPKKFFELYSNLKSLTVYSNFRGIEEISNSFPDIKIEINNNVVYKEVTYPFEDLCKEDYPLVSKVVIDNQVKFIKANAFTNMVNLKTVVFNNHISKIGTNAFKNCHSLTEVVLPDTVVSLGDCSFQNCYDLKIININNVRSIGNCCFENCNSLTNVITKHKVTEIGESAFSNCSVLSTFDLTNVKEIGKKCFLNCSNLTDIKINGLMKNIPDLAFKFCTKLSNIVIDNGVEVIGESAFSNCTSIKEVILPKSLIYINNEAFITCECMDKIIIPNNVQKIGQYAFSNCINLKEVYIGNSVISIDAFTFFNCSNLVDVEFSKESVLEAIGISAFENCTNILKLKLPDHIKELQSDCFKNCTSLKKITLGNEIVKINNHCFDNCVGLTNIILSNDLQEIGEYVFSDCISLSKVILNKNLKRIGKGAFNNCSSLKECNLIDGIEFIDEMAFLNCKKIASIELPYTIDRISKKCFDQCSNLQTVFLPGSITEIDSFAFHNCTKLKEIKGMDKVEVIEKNAFDGCSSITRLVFPRSLKSFSCDLRNCRSLEELIITSDLEKFEIEYYRNKTFRTIYLPKSIKKISIKGSYEKEVIPSDITIYTLRGNDWKSSLSYINTIYLNKESYNNKINEYLLSSGYTVAYSTEKIKVSNNNIDFNFGIEAFNDYYYDEEQTEVPIIKRRADFKTVILQEGNNENIVEESSTCVDYNVLNTDENSIKQVLTEFSVNEILLLDKNSDNFINSNFFSINYKINKKIDSEIIVFIIDSNKNIISDIKKIIFNKDVKEFKIEMGLNKQAEDGSCYLCIFCRNTIVHCEVYIINRLFNLDDFDIF